MNILIIDDEKDLCQLLSGMLTRQGHTVDYSLMIGDGMNKLADEVFDCVFLDNNLPDGFGLNYIQKILLHNSECRIIFMSAMANLKTESEALGAYYFMEKPITFKVIDNLMTQNSL
ncbi:Response regulator receiver domain-containing protein [Spirosomataceae bacterium TFI 002]|nr:Response regulator receiver domain-containing protein [Spirosomataceae bacterium TFI 002]